MKLTSTIISLMALFSFASADNNDAFHSAKYDHGESLINTVGCHNALQAAYPTLSKLPTYPNIGGYHNAQCGSCWKIVYESDPPIYVISVDNSNKGLQLSIQAMNTLKSDWPESEGMFIPVQITAADKANCGL